VKQDIDFVLFSCAGIPDSMWAATSVMLEASTKRCWRLLGAFLAFKMLSEAFTSLQSERLSVRPQLKALFEAFLIALWLAYYKPLLMQLDELVMSLSFFEEEVMSQARERASLPVKKIEGWLGWFQMLSGFLQGWVEKCAKGLFVLSHSGAVALMRYVRAVSVLISVQLGPFSALLSLLPGPFRKSFSLWSRSYVQLMSWHIVLDVLAMLSRAFAEASKAQAEGAALALGEHLSYSCLSIVLFVAIFLTPTWSGQLVSGGAVGNLLTGLSVLGEKGSQGLRRYQHRRATRQEGARGSK